jgi:hypothetical protein
MTSYLSRNHWLKSPMYGGRVPTAVGGGPTPPPPHTHASAARLKFPQHWGAGHPLAGRGPRPAPTTRLPPPAKAVPEEEEEELKQKNKPTFPHVSV